jgi:hypothetical protein
MLEISGTSVEVGGKGGEGGGTSARVPPLPYQSLILMCCMLCI